MDRIQILFGKKIISPPPPIQSDCETGLGAQNRTGNYRSFLIELSYVRYNASTQ